MFYRWLVVNREFQTVESRHHVMARALRVARSWHRAAELQDATVMTCKTCGAHACPAVGDRIPARFSVCPACDAPDCAEDRKAERWEADSNAD